jgi:hypothetical protein
MEIPFFILQGKGDPSPVTGPLVERGVTDAMASDGPVPRIS